MKKRGVSPIIATLLLISISVIIAVIIFLWARGFVGEKAEKFGAAIEFACEDIIFEAEAIKNEGADGKIFINNRGNVPINGLEVRQKSLLSGSRKEVGVLNDQITKGDSGDLEFNLASLNEYDELIVVPIILGKVNEQTKSYVCDEEFGEEIKVKVL
jgi:hypothetical protein